MTIGCRANFQTVRPLYELGIRAFQFKMEGHQDPVILAEAEREGVIYRPATVRNNETLRAQYRDLSLALPNDAMLIGHAIDSTNLVVGGQRTESSLRYLQEVIETCHACNMDYLIAHPGYRGTSRQLRDRAPILEEEASRDVLLESLNRLEPHLEEANVMLCLENGAGSRTGLQMASIDLLLDVVRQMDSSYVGLCYDTQHAWANGEDNEMRALAAQLCNVMHLNGTPERARFGRHLDRHGRTALQDSVGMTEAQLEHEFHLIGPSVPVILERKCDLNISRDIITQDLETISSWLE
jgi:sugar phosphate isomerase/epimerase